MRLRPQHVGLAGVVAASSFLIAEPTALADSMDPALARLVQNTDCRTPNGQYNPTAIRRCQTDDQAFAKLVSQYGGAIIPTPTYTAGTTGFGGFKVGIQAAYTKIDGDAEYWQRGTEGDIQDNTAVASSRNTNPDGFLQVYTFNLRKGLPLGLEFGSNIGFMANTRLWLVGGDVRWSLLEGFREGAVAVLPEVSVGGSVRTTPGSEELQLTAGSFDVQLGKPLPVAGATVITPYAGYQWARIFGNSGQVDLTPNTDALNLCNYQGPNTPATPDPNKTDGNGNAVYDGQPVCAGGTSDDFNNNVVFDEVALSRHRIDFGVAVRIQMVELGAHFMTDVVDPADANTGEQYEENGVNDFEGVPKQWTLAFDLGAVF